MLIDKLVVDSFALLYGKNAHIRQRTARSTIIYQAAADCQERGIAGFSNKYLPFFGRVSLGQTNLGACGRSAAHIYEVLRNCLKKYKFEVIV